MAVKSSPEAEVAEETLLSAARRVLRDIRIDEAHGGLVRRDTLRSCETLDKEIRKETARQQAAGETPTTGAK